MIVGKFEERFRKRNLLITDIWEAKKELNIIRKNVALMPHSRRETEWIIQIDTFLIEWFGDST